MSNRTLIEINHDAVPTGDVELLQWARQMDQFIRTGNPNCLPSGVTFFRMRHHSEPCPMGDPPRGWNNQAVSESGDRKPKRIQRKRTKGWRMPDNAVSITRPGKFGNPYKTAYEFRHVLEAVRSGAFSPRELEHPALARMKRIADAIGELRGKDLACWCEVGQPCHGDILLELANAEANP